MNPKLILIAEDDPDLRELLCTTLEAAGFRTVEAGDGDTAALILATAEPIGMITDVSMPGADGVRLCRLARGNPASRDMAIVMVSGQVLPDSAETGLSAGADRYLTKPLSSRSITAALRQVIELRQLTDDRPEAL
jgi:two-component system response regulator MtrA